MMEGGTRKRAEDGPGQVLRLYEAAFNANDADAMASLFLEQVLFVNFSGVVVHGRDRLHRAQAFVFGPGGPLEHVSVRYELESLIEVGKGVAVLQARQRGLGKDGHVVPVEGDAMHAILMLLLVRTGEGWRIRVGQNTPVAG